MGQKSAQMALGGIFSALCVTLMFFTGVMPFGRYALPIFAGVMIMPVVIELGTKTALTVYISVSILSVLLAPDRQAVMIFVAFFGYYPIVKGKLEKLPGRAPEYAFKLLLFNGGMVGGFMFMIYVLGMAQAFEGIREQTYAPLLFLGAGNILFFIYDMALTQYYTIYVEKMRPKILRK